MLKMSIIAKNEFAVLGINGVRSFFESLRHILDENDSYDAVQILDEKFLESIRSMETFPYGFTEEYKAKFVHLLEKHLNEKILITDDWLSCWKGKKEQSLMKFVGFLNDGLSFDTAKQKVIEESKEVSIV